MVKHLPALLKGITSNHHPDFYCLNCFHSYRTNNKLKRHEGLCNKHDYCYVDMPKVHKKIVKYNHREKSLKAPFLETLNVYYQKCLLVKIILKNLTQKE